MRGLLFLALATGLYADRAAVAKANREAQVAQTAGEYAVAEARLNYALRISQVAADDAILHGNLAALFLEQQEYERGLAECRKSLAIQASSDILNGLGIALQGLGRLDEAEAAYAESLAGLRLGSFEHARTRFNLATVWAQRGRTAEALSEARVALPLLVSDPLCHATALWQAAAMTERTQAAAWLEQAQGLLDQHGIKRDWLRRQILLARAAVVKEKKLAGKLRKEAESLRTPQRAGVSVEALRKGY